MSLSIYSTLSRRQTPFTPIHPGKVGMYVCGVTVYDYCHIGHGRTFVAFDVVRRWLEASGYEVTFVRNVTDVDDKIIRRAAERGISTRELTERFTQAMQEDFQALGCLTPTYEPRATQFIPSMLSFIGKLMDNGYAYRTESGDVDYSVRKFASYGALSGKNVDELESGARVDVDSGKKDPLDFALWKHAKPGEPQWDSPWGKGRPGWHIECSAMSCHYLGTDFDIHGGGPDLIFPHHENEIAQSEGACPGSKFAHIWMHSGPLRVRNKEGVEEKMSKSLGNFWTIRDAIKETNERYGEGNGNETLRFFLLRSQYRSPITFGTALIEDAHKALMRFYEALCAVEPAQELPINWNDPFAAQFKAAMDEDFNTAQAIGVLFELTSEVNRSRNRKKAALLRSLGGILNLLQRNPAQFVRGSSAGLDENGINSKIAERAAAKKARDFAKADAIRKELAAEGIILVDGPQGTTWRRA